MTGPDTVEGRIIRALSGFYTVAAREGPLVCRARGRFRSEGITPLVGDRVEAARNADGSGTLLRVLPRENAFARPAVANVELLVIVLSEVIPVTEPYLVDRILVRCAKNGCRAALVICKCDLSPGDRLAAVYAGTGLPLWRVSAVTGVGIEALRAGLQGRFCCFTGNSGVGKSSLLNALCPALKLPVGDVSRKLGRGRHTTRHVEVYDLGGGTFAADTPGFASFDDEGEIPIPPGELPAMFPEFRPFLGDCRFDNCTHRREPGCAVRAAVGDGGIHPVRYASYLRLYEEASRLRPWERTPDRGR